MTEKEQDPTPLLSVEEQAICQKIVARDTDIAGRRAATLLAINAGVTQAEASAQAGLTAGQIRYLLTAFRKKRLAIFPDEILRRAQSPAKTEDKTDSKVVNAGQEEPQAPAKVKKEKKKKKSKKDKKIKAGKLGKKAKKTKGKGKKAGKKKSKK